MLDRAFMQRISTSYPRDAFDHKLWQQGLRLEHLTQLIMLQLTDSTFIFSFSFAFERYVV